MYNKNNEQQKISKQVEKWDLTPLLNFVTFEIEPPYLAGLFDEIKFNYIDMMLKNAHEEGIQNDAIEQHYYMYRLQKALRECKPKE